MSSKIFWVDTETTGLDPKDSSVIQIAGMVEVNETIREEVDLKLRPLPEKKISPEALAVNGRTEEEMARWPLAAASLRALSRVFDKYVNRFDKNDKFVPAGYNVNFDLDFIRENWRCALPADRYGIGCYFF